MMRCFTNAKLVSSRKNWVSWKVEYLEKQNEKWPHPIEDPNNWKLERDEQAYLEMHSDEENRLIWILTKQEKLFSSRTHNDNVKEALIKLGSRKFQAASPYQKTRYLFQVNRIYRSRSAGSKPRSRQFSAVSAISTSVSDNPPSSTKLGTLA